MQLKDFNKHILCPTDRHCYPQAIKNVYGNVINAENILSGNASTVVLKYDTDTAPKIIVDLGASSTGGYPVFKVKSFSGTPVLRLAYSDWYDYIVEEPYCDKGDCVRGFLKYLGVELPVLPGDPNRYNLFTITHTGEYISPLVQGQERFMMLKLDTPGAEVELEYAYIYYTADMSGYDGAFECSDDNLTRLWYAHAWTCQIATLLNSQSWDAINNKLLLRALSKGNDAGIYKEGTDLTDYTVSCKASVAHNPQMCSGFGMLVRAENIDGGYAAFLNLDGTITVYKRANGVYALLKEEVSPVEITDNRIYDIALECKGNSFTYSIDGKTAVEFTDSAYTRGTFGFCQTTEKRAVVYGLTVTAGNETVFEDDFSDETLSKYEFTRSAPFISDGAKRDRLPWIGDLDWADRNIFYAFKDFKALPETLRMFAFNQTPEGYIWGTCYPENTKKPAIGEYGYYESDIFSAWFIPTVADYLLFTGDKEFCREVYKNVKDDVNYLWRFVEADGLFNQRYATSKGLWDHVLNDMGKFSYNNLIVSEAFGEASFIAEHLGYAEDAAEFMRRKQVVRKAIREKLTSKEGYLTKSLTNREMCDMANSLALSIHYFTDASDARPALEALLSRTPGHGKITALMIRGAYMYGFDEEAFKTLYQPGYKYVKENEDFFVYDALENPNFDFVAHSMHPANWIKALNDDRGPQTAWECMTYPPSKEGKGNAWGDRAHPDAAIGHILSAYVLGVFPQKPGFEEFSVEPHTYNVAWCKGIVPTMYGNITVEWNKNSGELNITTDGAGRLSAVTVAKNDGFKTITLNGKPAENIIYK